MLLLLTTLAKLLFLVKMSRADPDDRVVEGEEIVPHSFPSLVAIYRVDKFRCGGTLLHPQWVLSAAHCATSQSLTLVAGAHNISKMSSESNQKVYHKSYVHRSPDPLPTPIDFLLNIDIVLIRLEKPFNLTQTVQPVKLAKVDFRNDETAIVVGWGRYNRSSGRGSSVPMKGKLSYYDQNLCNASFASEQNQVYDREICYIGIDGQGSACHGDSGGPLFAEDEDGSMVQFGIVSRGKKECAGDSPTVYTDIRPHLPWILENIQPGRLGCNKRMYSRLSL